MTNKEILEALKVAVAEIGSHSGPSALYILRGTNKALIAALEVSVAEENKQEEIE